MSRLGGVLGRLGASKIDVERASKFDEFSNASWNRIFSAQEPSWAVLSRLNRSAAKKSLPPGSPLNLRKTEG